MTMQHTRHIFDSRRPSARAVAGWILKAGLLAAVLFAAAWVIFPFPKGDLARYPAATVLLDCEGTALRLRLGPGDTDCRLQYRPDPARDWICQAVVAAEDQRFWRHHGVDPLALGRAIRQNLTGRRVVSGASTISTQVIRLMHPRRRTWLTKGVEYFRALQLETLLDKKAILEQYLNRAPFGANLVGIEAASRRYFGKAPQDLSLAEAALLAGLPQAPSRLRPDRFPARARQRQAYVLARLAACGRISDAQRIAAASQPIALRPDAYPFSAPHFCELVLERGLVAETGGGLRTTLDPTLQRLAEETLRRHAVRLQPAGIGGGAVVILDVRSGAVRALVGAPDYHDLPHAGQVNGAAAPRSAGSTLKPFLYALAMDQGRITPATMLSDLPRTFKDSTPVNFDGAFNGWVPARGALVLSLNLPALTLAEQVGVPAFLGSLRQLGLDTLNRDAGHYGLSLALGAGSVRLLDLANAYACLARGGEWKPYALTATASREESRSRRVFSLEAAWLVADMLGGDERSAATTGHRADVRLPRVAWKTGTSSGFRDAWAVAFNPEYVIGVWIGNPDGQGASTLVGATAAAPVMWDLVRGIYPANATPWFDPPAGVSRRTVCAASGGAIGPHCTATVVDWQITGASMAHSCARCQAGATAGAPVVRAADTPPRIVSPQPGTVYRKLDDFRAEQRLPLRAEDDRTEPLYWFIDDQLVAAARTVESASWPLVRGKHVVVCCDSGGQSAKSEIMVE
jgi:penicillin-binding protein 1C